MTSRIMAGIDAAQCQWIAEETEWALTGSAQGERTQRQQLPRSEQVEVFANQGMRIDVTAPCKRMKGCGYLQRRGRSSCASCLPAPTLRQAAFRPFTREDFGADLHHDDRSPAHDRGHADPEPVVTHPSLVSSAGLTVRARRISIRPAASTMP
jgi:hypothetical protein